MLLSSENKSLRLRVGERQAIEILAKAGFDAVDYTFTPFMERDEMAWTKDNYVQYAKEVRLIADDNGVHFNQAHGPYKFDLSLLPDLSRQIIPLQARCLECCALLGIPRMVVHPLCDSLYRGANRKRLWDLNAEYYRRLRPYAEEFGVKVSLENIFYQDRRGNTCTDTVLSDPVELAAFYDALEDTENFDVLLDVGHSGLVGGDAAGDIRTLGGRIRGLHVHDNDFASDAHLIPYEGKMDWDGIMQALADVDYPGDLTFEALHPFENIDLSLCEAKARYLHDVGRCLIDKFNTYSREKKAGEKA